MYQPEKDEMHMMRSRMLDDIVGLLGGRVAEKIIFDDFSTGASNDIERASEQARKMVTRYGMSDRLGPIAFGQKNDEVFLGKDYNHMRNYSETVAAQIDDEVEKIILSSYERTESILREHIDKLHAVAEELVKREKLTGDEFYMLMEGKELPPFVLSTQEENKEDKPEAEALPEITSEEADAHIENAEGEVPKTDTPTDNSENSGESQ